MSLIPLICCSCSFDRPGGPTYWQAVDVIEAVFSAPLAQVISADINEIVPGRETVVTQFTSAMLAAQVFASHLVARAEGRWTSTGAGAGRVRAPTHGVYFTQ